MKIERPQSTQPIPDNAKKVFSGVVYDVYHWEQKLYNGTTTTFEKLKRSDSVVIFPILEDGRIILTEQEQPGKDPFIGTCGGKIDEGEDVLEAAKRELLEESGYTAEQFILWDARHVTSKIDWVIYTFIAKGLKKVSEQNLDGGEKIKLKIVTFDELLEISRDDVFSEKQIVPELMEARMDLKKKEELRNKFGFK